MQTVDSVLDSINRMKSLEDIAEVRASIQALEKHPAFAEEEVDRIWKAYYTRRDELGTQTTADTEQLLKEIHDVLRVNGVEYPLSDWLTPSMYAKRFEVKNSETVMNWIRRGIVPAENVIEVPALGIKLIKAVRYEARPYNRGE